MPALDSNPEAARLRLFSEVGSTSPRPRRCAPELGHFVATAAGAATSPTLAAELYRRTGGNPFFAREVVRLLLAVAAVIGESVSLEALTTATRQPLARYRVEKILNNCRCGGFP